MFSEKNSKCRRKFLEMCLDYIAEHFAGCKIKQHNKVSDSGNITLFDATIYYEGKELYLRFIFEKENFELCSEFASELVFDKLLDKKEHPSEDEYVYSLSYKDTGTEALNNI